MVSWINLLVELCGISKLIVCTMSLWTVLKPNTLKYTLFILSFLMVMLQAWKFFECPGSSNLSYCYTFTLGNLTFFFHWYVPRPLFSSLWVHSPCSYRRHGMTVPPTPLPKSYSFYCILLFLLALMKDLLVKVKEILNSCNFSEFVDSLYVSFQISEKRRCTSTGQEHTIEGGKEWGGKWDLSSMINIGRRIYLSSTVQHEKKIGRESGGEKR